MSASQACMEFMLGDGICDSQCNNRECDYNDCTSTQIQEKCLLDQEKLGVSYDLPPPDHLHEELVPINIQFDLAPARLEIRMEINEMVLSQEVGFSMQWQDSRLALSPCKVVLGLHTVTTSLTHGYSLSYTRLQPLLHTIAASLT